MAVTPAVDTKSWTRSVTLYWFFVDTGVRKLAFFDSVDWDSLLEVEPLFVPQPGDDADTTCFEGKESL